MWEFIVRIALNLHSRQNAPDLFIERCINTREVPEK